MDWIKRNLRDFMISLIIGAASVVVIAMLVDDAIKINKKFKDYDAQIVELQQELALVKKELHSGRERARTP